MRSIEIDQLIRDQYADKKYSELKALSRLFSKPFMKGLEKILNKDCRVEKHYKQQFDVSLGWIDKIPLASIIPQTFDINGHEIKNKVELGDFILVFTDTNVYKKNEELVFNSLDNRAIIVQAKVSNQRNPLVPIGKINSNRVNSTSKELCLMSSWPAFDLFKTSRSKNPILKQVHLKSNSTNSLFSGYFEKMWYCGQPINKIQCNETLGKVIDDLVRRKTGEPFKDKSAASDWDQLINKLIELCGEYQLPGYLFGKNKSRYINSGKLYFNPFQAIIDFFRRKRFPILFINLISFEGEF